MIAHHQENMALIKITLKQEKINNKLQLLSF